MGDRFNRLVERKRNKKVKKRKNIILLLTIIFLVFGILTVDKTYSLFESDSYIELDNDDHVKVFAYEYKANIHTLQLFGKEYFLEDHFTSKFINSISNETKKIYTNIKQHFNK